MEPGTFHGSTVGRFAMSASILHRLREVLGDRAVRPDDGGEDEGGGGIPRVEPESTEAVAAACGLAHQEGWRVRIEGRGSWMPRDAPADLTISTCRFHRIVDIAPADLIATVDAGIGLDALGRELAARGSWLPVDPPGRPERSLGSVVASGTAGPLRHGFGPVRDHVLGSTVVTGDGRVISAGGRVVKNVAGFDLTRLQVGAFGAFGIITRLHLRLRAQPAARLTLLATGPRDVLTRQARALMEDRLAAAALELCSPPNGDPDRWCLWLDLTGTDAGNRAEADRAVTGSEVTWTTVGPDQADQFRAAMAHAPLTQPVTIRIGVLADGLDETLDLLETTLAGGVVTAGPGRGLLRWSGSPDLAALRTIRQVGAEREMPVTLERGPWPLRKAFGHFGAYREGVGPLVSRLKKTFDPDSTFVVSLEGNGAEG